MGCQRCGGIGIIRHSWWECKMLQLLWKSVSWFLDEPDIEFYDPTIPHLGISPKDVKTGIHIKNAYTNVYSGTIYNS